MCLSFFNIFLKIEVQLMYDTVLVSGVQQSDSGIYTYIYYSLLYL